MQSGESAKVSWRELGRATSRTMTLLAMGALTILHQSEYGIRVA